MTSESVLARHRGRLPMVKLLIVLAVAPAALIYKILSGSRLRDAVMRTVAPLLYRFAAHRRLRRHMRRVGDVNTSRCRSCGAPMEKHGRDGEWELAGPFTLAPQQWGVPGSVDSRIEAGGLAKD